MFDDGVGRVEDGLRRPVILLQQDGGGLRVVALELQNVTDRRPTEGVDGLVCVAHHAQFRSGSGGVAVTYELPNEGVLGVIGVLVLVYQ